MTELLEKNYVKVLLIISYFILFVVTFKYINSLFTPKKPYVYGHPFDQWWRRKETNISNWYQDHYFDSKRRDNLFPTYQNI
jgi:hypothetical protein